MALKTLLLVTQHFPPSAASGSFRLTGFARHLPRFGWRVVVIAPQPGAMHWEPEDPSLLDRLSPETVIVRAPYNETVLSYPLRWYAQVNSWIPRAWPVARRRVRTHGADAVMTSGPPHAVHAVGLWLKRRFGLPWVADFRDPWLTANPGYRPRPGLSSWTARRYERATFREADAIIANAPRAGEAVAEACPEAAGRIVVITNGFDPDPKLEAAPATGSGALRITHAGQFYADRTPGRFLEAVRSLQDDRPAGMPDLEVEFLGHADSTVNVADAIDRLGLGSTVRLAGQVPYAEALRAMSRSDVLLLVDQAGRRQGVPAKLYEYLGVGRPVLALVEPDSDSAWVLGESGIPHRSARPSDAGAIRQALIELALKRDDRDESKAAGDGRRAFTREHLAGKLAEILDAQLAARGSSPAVETGATA